METGTLGGNVAPNKCPFTKKINAVLDTRIDLDKELLEALQNLSTHFTENTIRTRRNLRSNIEKQSLQLGMDIVGVFCGLKNQLDDIYGNVKAMNDCSTYMMCRLEKTRTQTGKLLSHTNELQQEYETLSSRKNIAEAFISKFQLSDAELRVIASAPETLSEEFFAAVNHLNEIHGECEVLLRCGTQTAGVSLLEWSGTQVERALERLYRWTQSQMKAYSGKLPDLHPLLAPALDTLRQRPTLRDYCLDEYVTVRRTAILRCFIDALTRGDSGGNARPIELLAHDPLRYIGDMMAWLHQSLASELEAFHSLLGGHRHKGGVDTRIAELLGDVTKSLCRPLRLRVEQVLLAEDLGSVILHRINCVLRFYLETFRQFISPECDLSLLLEDIEQLSQKRFLSSLQDTGLVLLSKMESPTSDLVPAPGLLSLCRLLSDLLLQPATVSPSLHVDEKETLTILQALLEPALRACSLAASDLQRTDMTVYLCNCMYSLQQPLMMALHSGSWVNKIQAMIDGHVESLSNEQAGFILRNTGLVELYTSSISSAKKSFPANDTIIRALKSFDQYLHSLESFELPVISKFLCASTKASVRRKGKEFTAAAYKSIHSFLSSGWQMGQSDFVLKTPEQITTLLS